MILSRHLILFNLVLNIFDIQYAFCYNLPFVCPPYLLSRYLLLLFYCVMELSKQVTGQAGQGGMKLDKAETGVKLGWAVLGESG